MAEIASIGPGYQLDRYELIAPIAEGGMGAVWLGRLRGKYGFEKFVAIKTILRTHASDHHFRQMFLDEARIASDITHANVCHIHDLGEQDGHLYLVMEWVDGESLDRLATRVTKSNARFPLGVALQIVADASAGLHAAHELTDRSGKPINLVHRDVSPQNILVSEGGSAKLIDFGIAKARDRLSGETASGLVKGKMRYMAPEQALGLPLDRRSDVWAMGAVLHRLVVGHAPFVDPEALFAFAHGRQPLPDLPAELPGAVSAVLRRALARDASDRFATAAELQVALERASVAADVVTTTSDVATFMADGKGERKSAASIASAVGSMRDEDLASNPGAATFTPARGRRTVTAGSDAFGPPAASGLPTAVTTSSRPGARPRVETTGPNEDANTASPVTSRKFDGESERSRPSLAPRRTRAMGVAATAVAIAVAFGFGALAIRKSLAPSASSPSPVSVAKASEGPAAPNAPIADVAVPTPVATPPSAPSPAPVSVDAGPPLPHADSRTTPTPRPRAAPPPKAVPAAVATPALATPAVATPVDAPAKKPKELPTERY
ncbi:MAG: serine/threonine-protein kinase [Polyangiaceae bacterium]